MQIGFLAMWGESGPQWRSVRLTSPQSKKNLTIFAKKLVQILKVQIKILGHFLKTSQNPAKKVSSFHEVEVFPHLCYISSKNLAIFREVQIKLHLANFEKLTKIPLFSLDFPEGANQVSAWFRNYF